MQPARHNLRCHAALVLPALLVTTCAPVVADEPVVDRAENVRLTVELLEKRHLTHRALDDELSAEWLAEFIRLLDPRHMYFLQSDIEQFHEYSDRLDDLTKTGDYQFPEFVRGQYRLRTSHMQNVVEELLAGEFDFSIHEEMPLAYNDYAVDTDSFHERWRQRIKFELLTEKLYGRDLDEVKEQLRGRYARIAEQGRRMSDERLYTHYMTALASRYDADTMFMSDTFLSLFEVTVAFPQFSLGLGLRERGGRMIIDAVYPRLRPGTSLIGWELIAIVSEPGEVHDIVELHPEDLTHLVLSSFKPLSRDTSVTLELMHPNTLERRTLSWFRYRI